MSVCKDGEVTFTASHVVASGEGVEFFWVQGGIADFHAQQAGVWRFGRVEDEGYVGDLWKAPCVLGLADS